jgi:hypothetical protein
MVPLQVTGNMRRKIFPIPLRAREVMLEKVRYREGGN